MTNDPLDHYQAMMRAAKAPDHLSGRVLDQVRAQQNTDSAATPVTASASAPSTATATPTSHRTPEHSSAPTFSVKRRRATGFAIAACAVLALGVGALALSPFLSPTETSNGNGDEMTAPQGNFFTLSAFASEGGQPANGPVTLSANDFMPVRTSAGPQFNTETGGYEDFLVASRAYNLNLTCLGENITNMNYELVGEGVSLYNTEIKIIAGQDNPDLRGDQSSSFAQDFADQNAESDGTHFARHEVVLEYALTDDEEQLFYEQDATVTHKQVSDGSTGDEAELAAWREASNRLDTALALHDAQYLAQAKIVLTATFTDGTTATKTYQLAPVANFEQAYAEYLSTRSSWQGPEKPDFPALYTIEEIA